MCFCLFVPTYNVNGKFITIVTGKTIKLSTIIFFSYGVILESITSRRDCFMTPRCFMILILTQGHLKENSIFCVRSVSFVEVSPSNKYCLWPNGVSWSWPKFIYAGSRSLSNLLYFPSGGIICDPAYSTSSLWNRKLGYWYM